MAPGVEPPAAPARPGRVDPVRYPAAVARTLDDPAAAAGGSAPRLPPVVRLVRPKQWVKNVLVFAAPGAAGVLDNGTELRHTLVAFACFCLAASGTYCINDARDAESDRRHPTKRRRPVAAGQIGAGTAYALGAGLLVAALLVAASVRAELLAAVAGYVVLTTAYSAWLKHVAVVDLVAVASGFVLRAIGGAAATDVPISNWFFIVASFGSLFMVAGKRGAEAVDTGEDAVAIRPVLAAYGPSFTAYLRSVCSSAVLVSYCLWAFEKADESTSSVPWYQLSILPFVIAIFRYALVLVQGRGAAPEDVVLSDRILQVVGLVWVVVFGIGVYTA
jgi:decaprenyl-phosphate phosphoribosyltransferase